MQQLVKRLGGAVFKAIGQGGGGHASPARPKLLGGHFGKFLLLRLAASQRAEQIEGRVLIDVLEDFRREVFAVGQQQRLSLVGLQDLRHHPQQLGRSLRDGFGGAAEGEGDGLMGLGVETKEGLQRFDSLLIRLMPVAAHLPLGVAAQVVGVDRQQLSPEVSAGAPQAAQGHLQLLAALDGLGLQEVVDGLITGDERQAVSDLEAFLAEAVVVAHPGHAQGRFMDQLQSQTGLDGGAGPAAPAA